MFGRSAGILILTLGVWSTGMAHHSLVAHYNLDDIRSMTGKVLAVEWKNPHTIIQFEWVNESGTPETWLAEAGSINTLNRTGLSRDTIQVGSTVTLIGPASRRGRKELLAGVMESGGVEYLVFPAIANAVMQPPPPQSETVITAAAGYEITLQDAPDIFGVWAPVRFPGTGLFPADLPLTEKAQVALDAYDAAADDTANQCLPAGMPSMLDQPYPIEFINEGEQIRIRFEEWEGERMVYMDGRKQAGEPSIFGHSTGRLEGDTLTIETSGIAYDYYNDAGVPLTEAMTVTERYWIDEARHRLNWSATTQDPNIFTEPVTMEGWMVWANQLVILDFECDAG